MINVARSVVDTEDSAFSLRRPLGKSTNMRSSIHRRHQQKIQAPDEVIEVEDSDQNRPKSPQNAKKIARSLWKYLKTAWTGVISGTGQRKSTLEIIKKSYQVFCKVVVYDWTYRKFFLLFFFLYFYDGLHISFIGVLVLTLNKINYAQ